jgi:hypothetical protein
MSDSHECSKFRPHTEACLLFRVCVGLFTGIICKVARKPSRWCAFGEFGSLAVASRQHWRMFQKMLRRLSLRHKTPAWASWRRTFGDFESLSVPSRRRWRMFQKGVGLRRPCRGKTCSRGRITRQICSGTEKSLRALFVHCQGDPRGEFPLTTSSL